MLKIDNNLLVSIGLGSLPADEKNKLLAQIYETLEMRVGMNLARQMTEDQLKEFEQFINSKDEEGALKWLETNFPDYKKVVADELDKLKEEIKSQAEDILSAVANSESNGNTEVDKSVSNSVNSENHDLANNTDVSNDDNNQLS